MGYIIGAFLFFWAARFLIRVILVPLRTAWVGLRGGEYSFPRVANYLALMSLVCGFIAVVEIIAPSTVLTGLERPESPEETPSRLAELPRFEGALSYQELATKTYWLRQLGEVDEEQFRADLRMELEYSRKVLADLQGRRDFASAYGVIDTTKVGQEARNRVLSEALEVSLKALPEIFRDGPMPYLAAEASVLDAQIALIEVALNDALEEWQKAEQAVNAYSAATDGKTEQQLDLLSQLRRANNIAREQRFAISRLRDDVLRRQDEVTFLMSATGPDTVIPAFNGPIKLFEYAYKPRQRAEPNTGHALPWSAGGALQRVKDAFLGVEPEPRRTVESFACYFDVLDDAGEAGPDVFCEASVALDLRYDLTSAECVSFEEAPANPYRVPDVVPGWMTSCIESWSRPHLNILLRPGEVVIFEPRPANVSAAQWGSHPTRISNWTVDFAGERKPLDGRATFPWDGQSEVYKNITLTHSARPDAKHARIWPDFSFARKVFITPLLIGAGEGFEAQQFEAVNVAVHPPRSLLKSVSHFNRERAIEAPDFSRNGSIAVMFRRHLTMQKLEWRAHMRLLAGSTQGQTLGCRNIGGIRPMRVSPISKRAQFEEIIGQMEQLDCASQVFVYALMASFVSDY